MQGVVGEGLEASLFPGVPDMPGFNKMTMTLLPLCFDSCSRRGPVHRRWFCCFVVAGSCRVLRGWMWRQRGSCFIFT